MLNNLQWKYVPIPDRIQIKNFSEALFSDTKYWQKAIACLLLQKGIETREQAQTFFAPSWGHFHDPFLMKDMDKAVERILLAIDRKENILIYGDYDVDGTCSVSLLYQFLSQLYSNVSTYVPDRYREGYGVSFLGIDYAEDNGVSLMITLDCGIKAHEKVIYAREKGIEMIITDHHTPSDTLPQAIAVLNPKREDCSYPYKELCGCGIGFKLIQAIQKRLQLPEELPSKYLELVALATCADIVPLTGENRLLVSLGLQALNQEPSPVMQALLASAKTPIQVRDLVFVAAPRINAAGRMQHAQEAVDFLSGEAPEKASTLETLNSQRKSADEEITHEALSLIEQHYEEDSPATIVFSPHWHKGVIGIVASRLIETYYRPTLVFTRSGEVLAASARSVSGYNLYQALVECKEYLLQFGGHKYAAGLTLLPENYLPFKQKFQEVVSRTLPAELATPAITLAMEMPLEKITGAFYNMLKCFAPFGPQNMTPIFFAKKVFAKEITPIGKQKEHLRLQVTDATGKLSFAAVGFGLSHKKELLQKGKPFTIAYQLDENHWKGNVSLQLVLKDIVS